MLDILGIMIHMIGSVMMGYKYYQDLNSQRIGCDYPLWDSYWTQIRFNEQLPYELESFAKSFALLAQHES